MAIQESAQDFWNYSLALYGQAQVARNCLKLQDQFGSDANILLLCCWAASRHAHELSADELRALVAASAEWRETIVQPTRRLRQQLKPALKRTEGGPKVYEILKQAELESERAEQGLLIDVFMTFEVGECGDKDAASKANSAMGHYLGILGCGDQPEAIAAIAGIAEGTG